MSESRTDTSAGGPSEGRSEHDRDHEEFQARTGYQPSTNQARDEPVPASHHDEGGQEAGRRRGDPVRDDPAAGGQGDGDRADGGQAGGGQAGGGQAGGGQAGGGQTGGGQDDGRDTGRGQASHDETGQDG